MAIRTLRVAIGSAYCRLNPFGSMVEITSKMKNLAIVNTMNQISSIDAREINRIFVSSGLRSIINSFARIYIVHLLYYEPEGLTCAMIYYAFKKDLIHEEVAEEMAISRSHIVSHLSDFEVEGLVEKGSFKQYMLTEKGKTIFDFVKQLALEIANNPKLLDTKLGGD